jgi:hypothetical protein
MQNVTTHDRCWEDIPFLVNGSLNEAEQRRLLAHVESCAECGNELRQQRVLYAHLQSQTVQDPAPESSWAKLVARLDAESSEASSPSTQVGARKPGRWWIAAVWLQGIAIAALLTILLVPRHEFVTLSTQQPLQSQGSIRVVFAPDASLTRVNELLRSIEGEIVAGPSEAGVYTVALAEQDPAVAITTLRAHKEVLFAELTAAAHANRR